MTKVLASAIFQNKHISMYLQHLSHFKMKNISSQYRFLFLFWKIERNAAKLLFYLLLILMIKNSRSFTNLILVIVTKSRKVDSCEDIPDAATVVRVFIQKSFVKLF
jgi:hypothetical protein